MDPRRYYHSLTHNEAFARLEWLVVHGQRLGLLLGPGGSGKSLLLDLLTESLAERGALRNVVAKCSLLGLDQQQLLLALAEQLQLNPRTQETIPALWRKVTDRLHEHAYQQIGSVLLFDDVHAAQPDAFTAISRLVELNLRPGARLTIVLACDERHVRRLGERLVSRCSLRIDTAPWDAEETLAFVQHALDLVHAIDDAAGEPRSAQFTPAAMDKIHTLSQGIPRRASQLAQWALVAGTALGQGEIDDDTVVAAAEEIGVGV